MREINYSYSETTLQDILNLQENTVSDLNMTVQSGVELKIPNQCWIGYTDLEKFKNNVDKPSHAQFQDFGKSVFKYGCAVCCCLGATNLLNDTNLTLYELYQKNGFVWDKNKKDNSGECVGATKASWNHVPGVNISYNKIKYDYDLNYSFCKASNYYKSPTISEAQVTTLSARFNDTGIDPSTLHHPNHVDTSVDTAKYYRAYQVKAIQDIQTLLSQGNYVIIYIANNTRNTGHYVLAHGFVQNQDKDSYSDILVLDPCPTGYKRNSYYNYPQIENQDHTVRMFTLQDAMNRINSDISDGIRIILKVSQRVNYDYTYQNGILTINNAPYTYNNGVLTIE